MEVNKSTLANPKRDYQQAAEDLKSQYNEQLSNLEETHKAREENQRENYIKQKEQSEKESAELVKQYDDKVRKEIDDRQQRYLKNLKSAESDFLDRTRRQVAENDYELNALKTNYENTRAESERVAAYDKAVMKDRFEDGLTRRAKDFDDKLDNMQKKNIREMNKFKEAQDTEKKLLMVENNDEKQSLIQEANLVRNAANSKHQLEKERLRENQKETIKILQNNAENQVNNAIKNKDIQQEIQRANFEEISKKINKRNADAFKEANLESKNDKARTEREYSNARMDMQRELNKIAAQPIEKQMIKEREKIESKFQNRVDLAQDETARVKRSVKHQMHKMSEDQKVEDGRRDLAMSEKIGEKDAEIRKLRTEEMSRLKDHFGDQLDRKNNQLSNEREAANMREVTLKKESERRMDLQRQDFNKQISQLSESKEEMASEMRENMAQEKSEFIEQVRRDLHKDKAELRENLNTQFIRKEDALNAKIDHLEKENVNLKERYEKQITFINKKHAEAIKKDKIMQNEIQHANKMSARRDVLAMNQKFAQEKSALKNDFERKINQVKSDSEIHVAKLTERYEDLIARERTDHQRELSRKTGMLYDELVRYKTQSDAEKAAIITQYENKLSEMQQSHRAQIEIRNTRKPITRNS